MFISILNDNDVLVLMTNTKFLVFIVISSYLKLIFQHTEQIVEVAYLPAFGHRPYTALVTHRIESWPWGINAFLSIMKTWAHCAARRPRLSGGLCLLTPKVKERRGWLPTPRERQGGREGKEWRKHDREYKRKNGEVREREGRWKC